MEEQQGRALQRCSMSDMIFLEALQLGYTIRIFQQVPLSWTGQPASDVRATSPLGCGVP
jgi:hypothetical protein